MAIIEGDERWFIAGYREIPGADGRDRTEEKA